MEKTNFRLNLTEFWFKTGKRGVQKNKEKEARCLLNFILFFFLIAELPAYEILI